MKIGVLSDTHIPRNGRQIPHNVINAMRGMDMIVHAGDISEMRVIRELEKIAPVEAVAGNVDGKHMREELGRKKIIDADGTRIGIIHGDGERGKTIDRVAKAFDGEDVCCVIFGHSHIPESKTINGVLYFNPGSPNDKRRQQYFSYGIIRTGNGISAEIIYF